MNIMNTIAICLDPWSSGTVTKAQVLRVSSIFYFFFIQKVCTLNFQKICIFRHHSLFDLCNQEFQSLYFFFAASLNILCKAIVFCTPTWITLYFYQFESIFLTIKSSRSYRSSPIHTRKYRNAALFAFFLKFALFLFSASV